MSISSYFLVTLPNIGPYDPRIALYCLEPFNDWIEDGKVWFQASSVDDKKVTVHFDPDDDDVKLVEYRSNFDGASIRRPDAPPDQAFGEAARNDVDAETWVESWDNRRVFDIHRLVLAPYRRSKERKACKQPSAEKGSTTNLTGSVRSKRKTPPSSTLTSPVPTPAASPVSLPPRATGAPSCLCKGKRATNACVCRSSKVECNSDCHSGLERDLKDKAQKHKNCENHMHAAR